MRISSAAAVVPPGEVTFWRRVAGGKVALEQQLARARHGGAREALGEIGGKAGVRAGLGQALDKMEHISRPGPRQGRDRIDEIFALDSHSTMPTLRKQRIGSRRCVSLTSRLAAAPVAPRPMLAGRLGMARTIAVAAGSRALQVADGLAGEHRDDERLRAQKAVHAPLPHRRAIAA